MAAADVYVSFGADTGGLEAAMAIAKAEVTAMTRELNALAREMRTTGASADSELGQKVLAAGASLASAKAQVSGFKEELKGVGEAGAGGLAGLLAPIAAMKEHLSGIIELVAGAFAVDKIIEFVRSMGELGEQTERTAKILGLTTQQVGELQYAFEATGTSAQNLDQMMGRFEENLAKPQTQTNLVAAGLRALGLSAKDLIGLPLPEQLGKIADATARFADGVNKTAALQSLGRGFVELIPLLDQGRSGLEDLKATADATNSVLDEMATARLVEMQHRFVELGSAVKGDGVQAFQPFVDVVNGAVRMMTDLAEAFSNSIKNGGFFGQMLSALAFAFKGIESAIAITAAGIADLDAIGDGATRALVQSFLGLGQTIGEMFKALALAIPDFFKALVAAGEEAVHAVGRQFADLGTVIGDTLHLDFAGAKAAFGAMGTDAAESASKIGAAFSGVFDFSAAERASQQSNAAVVSIFSATKDQVLANARTMQGELATIWGSPYKAGGAEGPEQDSKAEVPQLDIQTKAKNDALRQQLRDAEAEATAEIDAFKNAARAKEDDLNEQLKLHKISMGQWLAATLATLGQEEQGVRETYEKELKTAGLTSAQIIAIKTREATAIAEIQHQMAQAETKAAEDSARQYKALADQAAGLINSQVDGVLKGTTTIGQAFKNMAASAIEDIIKFLVKWVAEQAATVAANTAAIGAGAAAQKAINASTISGDASRAAAGAYAAVAGIPIIGPVLAPAAAAVAFAGVEAFGSMDIGAYDIPENQLALVHKNELVMPAAEAGAFRSMLTDAASGGGAMGGGGLTIGGPSISFPSFDPAGMAAAFENHKASIVKSVMSGVRDGAHLAGRRGVRYA